ncbi:MAG: MMPL family transporter, partial [Rhodospirillales bacterium]|nr:MMPL family transporter [Rhodospirillales bacterium]
GMAVDANVLIFERIREEVRGGRSPLSAVDAGYRRAITTIIDANLTTLIAAIILFEFGSGPVRGFAVTLAVGIMTSMFTAIMVTRLIIITWLRRRRNQTLPI